ncbi:MAG: hypothetical protein M1837_000109 [Sclerophora amabilis]|nr:MAG: hypothetical protein M1837_000109 [Sclerophora amabilis]
MAKEQSRNEAAASRRQSDVPQNPHRAQKPSSFIQSQPPGADTSGRCEGACGGSGTPTWYCVLCDSTLCDRCWDAERPHLKNKRGPDGLPHEKTFQSIARRLQDILEPSSDPSEQKQLHQSDEDTTWFGVARDSANLPILQDYGRYATIMQESLSPEWNERYPNLVSSVGLTGDGKSTLIKMLVDREERKLGSADTSESPSPVAGSVNDNVPTSGDVHLYADPGSYWGQTPLLYADCEGLSGGNNIPLGARYKVSANAPAYRRRATSNNNQRFLQIIRMMGHSSKRDITWATTPETRQREYAATHLYPRLLYTFSDVVVFVLRNDRTFESVVLQKLLDWASASIEKSLNQPALPHAIVVLNATDTSIDPSQWDVRTATRKLLSVVEKAIDRDPAIAEYAEHWRIRGKDIKSTEELIRCYYSSFAVVRVPVKGRYMLINEKIEKLQWEIGNRSSLAHNTKKRLRTLSNADELQTYLQMGFDHFSKNLDLPFDFVEHSWKNNPIPQDFGGNILRLALAIKDRPTATFQTPSGPRIFQQLSHMVASCVMLDYVRHRILGTAAQLLDHYMDSCDQALEDFCEDWWPCTYRDRHGTCNNTLKGHSKGHQDSRGRIFAAGDYQSDFTAAEYRFEWRRALEDNLNSIQKQMERILLNQNVVSEERAASQLHLDQMRLFYESLGNATMFSSNSACFCCLRELPEHPLICFHVLCTPCVYAYGRLKEKTTICMDSCPLHPDDSTFYPELHVKVKPYLAGVRVLALDGGGIRGIVELQVLRAKEQRLGGRIRIQDLISLLGQGTKNVHSTGGIVALGLGVENWTVDTCIAKFTKLCSEAFTPREMHGIPGLEQLATLSHKSKYKTRPLEEALKESFHEDKLFGGTSENNRYLRKVAVTSSTENGSGCATYIFERSEKENAELKTWEAARATSAAPKYFKPFVNEQSGHGYLDGALYNNNPVRVAHQERKLLWPDVENLHLDIFVSIGTSQKAKITEDQHRALLVQRREHIHGTPEQLEADSKSESKRSKWTAWLRFPKTPRFLQAVVNRVDNILDAEIAWKQFLADAMGSRPGDSRRYYRINPELGEHPAALDDVATLPWLQDMVKYRLGKSPSLRRNIEDVANRLVASSFCFEKLVVQPRSSEYLATSTSEGIPSDASDATLLTVFCNLGGALKEEAKQLIISSRVIGDMINLATFDIGQTRIPMSKQLAKTTIGLYLSEGAEHIPISGFPRQLSVEESLRVSSGPRTRTHTTKRYPSRKNAPKVPRSSTREDAQSPAPETRLSESSTHLHPSQLDPQLSEYPSGPDDVQTWATRRRLRTGSRRSSDQDELTPMPVPDPPQSTEREIFELGAPSPPS